MQRIQEHLVFIAGLPSYIKHFCPNNTMNGIDTYEEHNPRSFKCIVKGGMCTKGWCSKRFPKIIAYDKQQQTSERKWRSVDVDGKVHAGWSTLYSNPGRGKKFFLFSKTSKRPWAFYSLNTGSCFRGKKAAEVWNIPRTSVITEFNNVWKYIPFPSSPSWNAEASDLGMTEDWELARQSVSRKNV